MTCERPAGALGRVFGTGLANTDVLLTSEERDRCGDRMLGSGNGQDIACVERVVCVGDGDLRATAYDRQHDKRDMRRSTINEHGPEISSTDALGIPAPE